MDYKTPTNQVTSLIGTGPCLADLKGRVMLPTEAGVTVCIQGAYPRMECDYWLLYDWKCPEVFSEAIRKWRDEPVSARPTIIRLDSVNWRENWPSFQHGIAIPRDPKYVFKGRSGGSMGFALEFAISQGRPIELYGVDLDNGHTSVRKWLDPYLEKKREDKSFMPKITNCCPSSLLDVWPKESRPWTQ